MSGHGLTVLRWGYSSRQPAPLKARGVPPPLATASRIRARLWPKALLIHACFHFTDSPARPATADSGPADCDKRQIAFATSPADLSVSATNVSVPFVQPRSERS